ncbi:MAG: hypothetical protein DRI92_04410 [Aquificota bacterium]|nr:MAG: hypothetical protein DRI92_04410 [Aquificota bacterium]
MEKSIPPEHGEAMGLDMLKGLGKYHLPGALPAETSGNKTSNSDKIGSNRKALPIGISLEPNYDRLTSLFQFQLAG